MCRNLSKHPGRPSTGVFEVIGARRGIVGAVGGTLCPVLSSAENWRGLTSLKSVVMEGLVQVDKGGSGRPCRVVSEKNAEDRRPTGYGQVAETILIAVTLM